MTYLWVSVYARTQVTRFLMNLSEWWKKEKVVVNPRIYMWNGAHMRAFKALIWERREKTTTTKSESEVELDARGKEEWERGNSGQAVYVHSKFASSLSFKKRWNSRFYEGTRNSSFIMSC